MKRILTILLLLCSTLTYGQSAKHRTVGTDSTCIDSMKVALYMIGDLFLPIKGHFAPQWDSARALAYNPADSSVYVFTKYNWIRVGAGGGADSTVYQTVYGTDTMRYNIYQAIAAIVAGSVDSFVYGTRAFRVKGDDSLAALILQRLRHADTALMLQNYAIEAQMLGYLGLKLDVDDSLTAYPTVYGVDTAKANLRAATTLRELLSNKVTSFASPDNTTYPTTAAVNTLVGSYKQKSDSIANDGYTRRDRAQALADSVAGLIPSVTGYIPYTDTAIRPTANKIISRDANGNAHVNNLIQNGTTTAAANGNTAMTLASTLYQELTGSSGNDQIFTLPDATTITEFTPYVFDNNSDGVMTIKDHTGITLVSFGPGGKYEVRLKDNSSVAGTWDKHTYLSLGTNATTAGIQFTGFISAAGSVTGSNLSGTNTGDQTNGYGLNLSGSTFSADTATLFAKYTTTLGAGSGISITGRTITATGGSGTVTNVIGGTNISITGTSTIQPTVNITGTIAVANGGTGTTATTSVNTTPITYGSNNTVTASALTLTTTTLNPTVVTSSLTSVGTVTSGTWSSTIGSAATGSTQAINDNSTKIATTAYADRYHPVDTTISAAYTLTSRDFNRTIHCTNGSNIALTIPSGLGTTFVCVVLAEGAGTVTPTTSSTTFYYQPTSTTKIKSQGGATIRSWATANSYLIIGSLE